MLIQLAAFLFQWVYDLLYFKKLRKIISVLLVIFSHVDGVL